jgi:hypothetical protein
MSDCCSLNAKTGTAPAVVACPVSGTRSKQVDILTVKESCPQAASGNAEYAVLLLRRMGV